MRSTAKLNFYWSIFTSVCLRPPSPNLKILRWGAFSSTTVLVLSLVLHLSSTHLSLVYSLSSTTVLVLSLVLHLSSTQGSHANLKSKFHDFSMTKLRFSMIIFYERGIQSQVWSIKLNTLNKVKVDNHNFKLL